MFSTLSLLDNMKWKNISFLRRAAGDFLSRNKHNVLEKCAMKRKWFINIDEYDVNNETKSAGNAIKILDGYEWIKILTFSRKRKNEIHP